ncbi:MAG TPA: 3-deoxy-D-manno-octulosonic acid transferase [Afifellaceae bacterium]|nr:3-deoxy-D-manno-octulosonic acid transferase [Afifellaceae bacterium]
MIGWLVTGIYSFGGAAVQPLMALMVRWRAGRGKEDPARSGERFGIAGLERPEGRLVWAHAASIGETNAVLPLVDRLRGRGVGVLLTTGTVTSAAIADRRLPDGAVHQYVPLDLPGPVTAFLDHWKPELALFVESEIWPGILGRLRRRSVPFVLVNARMSERSWRRWRSSGPLGRAIMRRIGLCIAQTAVDARRFEDLGIGRVEIAGNLKFDVPAPDFDADALEALQGEIGGRPVFVAASTHEGEETTILSVHRRLRREVPRLLTIIVPRHPERGDAIAAEMHTAGLVSARRSAGEPIGGDTEVFLADSLGEMGLWLRLGTVAFLGASLVPLGGHNPIEPAKTGVPMLHGPHVANFADIFAMLADARASVCVEDEDALAMALARLLADQGERDRLAREARACVERQAGALDRTMAALAPYLPARPDAPEEGADA